MGIDDIVGDKQTAGSWAMGIMMGLKELS